MTKFQRILVPTDFSESARLAARTAHGLVQTLGSELILLHVIEEPGYGLNALSATVMEQVRKDLRAAVDRQLRGLAAELGDAGKVGMHVRSGPPAAQIVEFAAANAIDLIVIGTRGQTGLKHLLLGSTAERVIREAACPVLTVRLAEHSGA